MGGKPESLQHGRETRKWADKIELFLLAWSVWAVAGWVAVFTVKSYLSTVISSVSSQLVPRTTQRVVRALLSPPNRWVVATQCHRKSDQSSVAGLP